MTNPALLVFAGIAAAVVFGLAARIIYRGRRRRRLRAMVLPADQRAMLERMFPMFRRIPVAERRRLEGLITLFLAEKRFHGADGMAVTPAMTLLIAAQACLLVVNKPNRWYGTLSTIVIYPAAFRSTRIEHEGYIAHQRTTTRAGESWQRGPVILAWDETRQGAADDRDGYNVVFHEFAHQLDGGTGLVDGAPLLDADHDHRAWATIFQAAYERHQTAIQSGQPHVLDAYGATSPAEFFAVAVETFFERANMLSQTEPALYAELSRYFRLDPAAWTDSQATDGHNADGAQKGEPGYSSGGTVPSV